MNKCYRCKKPVPEADVTEAINRESDWRRNFEDEDSEERVLICIRCADELKENV